MASIYPRNALSARTASMGKRATPVRAVKCSASSEGPASWQSVAVAAAAAIAMNLSSVQVASAEFRLPPISKDTARCERGFVGNTIGQANAVSDKLLDLRECSYKGKTLTGTVLAGALMSDADFSDTDMTEVVLTKAYAVHVNLDNANLTNATIDRSVFDGASMRGTKFINAVLTGATYAGADLTGAVFEDAVIGQQDVKRLCENPTLVGESRMQVGCRQ